MIFSGYELLDIVIMTLAVGFIFKDVFLPKGKPAIHDEKYDPLAKYKAMKAKGKKIGTWGASKLSLNNGFVFAMVVTAPAIILHELGHKFLAMNFGLTAVFHAAYFWLILGVVLKLMSFGFIFFVPAYVSIGGVGMTPLMHSAVAFAGPAVNLLLFTICFLLVKNKAFTKKYSRYLPIFVLTYKINLFLFVFNMLPIPMFDGWHVYSGIIQTLF